MAFILGRNHKLYVQTTGTRAAWPGSGSAPNLALVGNCRDLTFSGDTATGDASTRGGGGFRQLIATLSDAEVEFEMIYDTADTNYVLLRNAWINKTVFGVAILDGVAATATTQGLWMDGCVTGFEWSQELEEPGKVTVTIANSHSAVPMAAVTVG
jgi:hypothetical protein